MRMEYPEDEIKIEYFESLEVDPLRECNTNENFGSNKSLVANVERLDYCDGNIISVDETQNEQECGNSMKSQHKNAVCKETSVWYRTQDSSGKYKCKFCTLTYSTIQSLRNHTKLKHPNEVDEIRSLSLKNKRKMVMKCHVCKEAFESLTQLETHVSENHLDKLAKSCQYCHASFTDDNEMLSHIFDTHKVLHNQTFLCNTCGYRTMKSSHYKQHIKTHQSNSKMKCQFCQYTTHYKPNMKTHERIHLNLKPYVCGFKGCDYKSSAKTALRSHELKHEPDKHMLFCDECNYRTIYRQCLKRHFTSHGRTKNLLNNNMLKPV